VGIKPGPGVVPAGLGDGSWFDMAENGPLATTVADCALVLSVLAGRPELAAVPEPGPLRIAVSTRNPIQGVPVAHDWAAAARETAAALRDAGHTVRQANPRYGQLTSFSALARWFAGTELDARQLQDRAAMTRPTRSHAALGRTVLRAGYPKPAGRDRWQHRAEQFFSGYDVLITPALAQSPPKALAWSTRSWLANMAANVRYAPFAAPWNLAGWPAMAVPAGVGSDGLPRSVQLVAPPGREAVLLGVATQLEALRPWHRTAPAQRVGGSPRSSGAT
jgi:amidase